MSGGRALRRGVRGIEGLSKLQVSLGLSVRLLHGCYKDSALNSVSHR